MEKKTWKKTRKSGTSQQGAHCCVKGTGMSQYDV